MIREAIELYVPVKDSEQIRDPLEEGQALAEAVANLGEKLGSKRDVVLRCEPETHETFDIPEVGPECGVEAQASNT